MRPRRFLPSLRLLLAFDAVMRHGSVTAAGRELSLTQSTVSRLILSLEAQLGVELFLRQRRRLIPQPVAQSYHAEVARALDIVQRASMAAVANPQGGTLSLAVLPTFAARWLGPRLGDFLSRNPGIALNMSTRIGPVDFAAEAFDAAITYGPRESEAAARLKLFDERVTACVSPAFAAAHRVAGAGDVTPLPRLILESRPTLWDDWFRAQGAAPVAGGGMLMDQFSMMIQTAISGLGIALLPDYLARIEISEGRLVPFLKQAVPVSGAYWLVWPEARTDSAPLHALRDWLREQG